jgi:hypothetical protein
MPRKGQRTRAENIPQTTKPEFPSQNRRYFSKPVKYILRTVSFWVVLSGLFAYLPLLTVDVASPLDPNDPFSYGPNKVRFLIGKILPEGRVAKQTLEGRRKRLRFAIETKLAQRGWQKVGVNTFENGSMTES